VINDIIRRNHEGVLLRYADPGVRRAFHMAQVRQPSDLERMAIIAAEHEILVLQIIAEHLEVSDIGMARVLYALDVIQDALDSRRARLGMRR
jgi:D-serine deaminase-like pyridoxal phosphate-dependent protein